MPRAKILYHASGRKTSTVHPTYGGSLGGAKKVYTTNVHGPASRKGSAMFYAKQYGAQKENHGRAYIHHVEHSGFHRDDIGTHNYTTKKVGRSRKRSVKGRPAEFVSHTSHPVVGGHWVKTHETALVPHVTGQHHTAFHGATQHHTVHATTQHAHY